MKNYAELASNGHPIMGFWTTACLGYIIYIQDLRFLIAGPLPVVLLLSVVSYQEMKQMHQAVRRKKTKYNKGRWADQSFQKRVWTFVKDVTQEIAFSQEKIPRFLLLAVVNFFIGILLYIWLVYLIMTASEIDLVMIGLAGIPLIWIFTVVYWLMKL